jgi:phage tail sheath protein FI
MVDGDYSLLGGKNGDIGDHDGVISGDAEAALIGDPSDRTGIYALDDDSLNISIAAVPGISQQSVQNSLVSIAETSKNFLAVLAPPQGLKTAQEAINWHNGLGDGRTVSVNSSYASVYWPHLKVFDTFTKSDIWLAPEAFAIGAMAKTDEVADPWFAPAGLTRGRLTKPVDVEVVLNQGDRDSLYQPGNAVNPIVKFAQDGIVIFGQRTAQRTPTALDRINVRRMMILIRKMILASTRGLVFEPNDPITWGRIEDVLNPMLDDIRRRRGITEFRVICDDTTNTPIRIDRNELWCRILIKPTKTAEILVFELNLTNQSADMGGS